MPYIKVEEDPICPMLRAANITTGVQLARVLGCSHPAAMRKIRDPGRLTVEDLRKINRTGHVPIEDIRAAL